MGGSLVSYHQTRPGGWRIPGRHYVASVRHDVVSADQTDIFLLIVFIHEAYFPYPSSFTLRRNKRKRLCPSESKLHLDIPNQLYDHLAADRETYSSSLNIFEDQIAEDFMLYQPLSDDNIYYCILESLYKWEQRIADNEFKLNSSETLQERKEESLN